MIHFEWTVTFGTVLHLAGMAALIAILHAHWKREVEKSKKIIEGIDKRTVTILSQLTETKV